MTDISDLVGGSAHPAPRPNVARGRVSKAPAATASSMTVTLENYSSLYEYEVPAGNWSPHGGDVPSIGAVCLVAFDDDGDAWVPQWEGAVASLRVTTLPLTPVTGQECYLAADDTDGILWHLRYNADSASTSKWEAVGGPPLLNEVPTSQNTSNTTYTDLGTVGPSIVLPVAGDYIVEIGATMFNGSNNPIMSYAIGATAAADADSFIGGTAFSAGSRPRVKTGLTAVTLTAKYKNSGASAGTFRERWMRVTPVRLGP